MVSKMIKKSGCVWFVVGFLMMVSCASTKTVGSAEQAEIKNDQSSLDISFPQGSSARAAAVLYLFDESLVVKESDLYNIFMDAFKERYIIATVPYQFGGEMKPGPAISGDPTVNKYIEEVKAAALEQNIPVNTIILQMHLANGETSWIIYDK
jgi:hypothetical protein